MGHVSAPRTPLPFVELVAGSMLALWLLVGRWGLDRLLPVGAAEGSRILQLRYAIVGVLVVATLAAAAMIPGRLRGAPRGPLLIFWALVLYLLSTILWAPDSGLAIQRGIDVSLVGVGSSAAWIWSRMRTEGVFRRSFWMTVILVCAVLIVSAFAAFGSRRRLAALGGGPNVFARNMGLSAIVGFSLLPVWRAIGLSLFTVSALLVVLSGSRGGMLSMVVGLITLILVHREYRGAKSFIYLIAGVLGLGVILTSTPLGTHVISVFTSRVLRLTIEQQHSAGRDALYQAAIELWRERPVFGHGLGGWRTLTGENYPHNVFLELACEGGAIAVVLFTVWLGFVVWSFWTRRRTVDPACVAAFILFFVASQFSGDLYDSRAIFMFAMLANRPVGRRLGGAVRQYGTSVPASAQTQG